jgi:F-type H+-transporting ATPase subunit c
MLEAAKLLSAGCATIGLGGAAAGIGLVFAAYILGTARNPSLKKELLPITILGFSICEATGLFCLMMAFLLLFAL